MHRHMTEKVVQNWKLLPEHRQLWADGFAQDTELQLLCIAAGLLIAGPQRDRLAAAFSLLGDTSWIQLLFSALSSCTEAVGFELGSSPVSRSIKSVSFVQIDGEYDMLTFSFSQLLPRTLPWHSLQFHSTSFNFLTGREARGQEVHLPPPPLCSSLVCKSGSKFGSVISGWSEPVFVGIILHRRLGLKP